MDKSISAADANRKFSQVLREVREGQSYVVTSHGKPVAKIVPAASGDRFREAARRALLKRLGRQKARKIGRWTRDELYENDAK
jgi:prevent-host-death family protein